jgi:hypothetical protein
VSPEDGILDDNDLGYDDISAIMSKSKESEPTVISKKEGQEQKNTLLRA